MKETKWRKKWEDGILGEDVTDAVMGASFATFIRVMKGAEEIR